MGGGICVIDFDNDGWPDLFFVNGTNLEHLGKGTGPSDYLYRNKGDGTFQDLTEKAGLRDSGWGMGCSAGDFDNDGDSDLYVTNFGPNVLYRNNGDGTFSDVTGEAGLGDPRWSTGAAFGDYDKDGDLDLYVANYVNFDFDNPGGDPRFCAYRGVTVACGPRGLPGAHDALFRNEGNGKFTDVTLTAGIDESEKYYGFQVIWTDVDLDGDLDIFVANDSKPNLLWQNNGDGTFIEMALLLGLAYNQEGRAQANMGADVSDYDGDGDLDFYSTNFSDDYHVLYQNTGLSYLQDVTFTAKIAQITFKSLGFGAVFGDFDNDGDPDILAANGHIYPEVQTFGLGSDYKQQNQLFRNMGNGVFEEIGNSLGPGLSIVKSSRGAALLDWDKDGDLDLAISNMNDNVDLLRNDLTNRPNYLQIVLQGTKSNRDAFGARVMVKSGETTQTQELHSSAGFIGSYEKLLHFGMGQHATAQSIEIFWPSGGNQVLRDIPANQRILVEEGGGWKPVK
jgi:hypothetical protein